MATIARTGSQGDLCEEVPVLLDAKLCKARQSKAEAKKSRVREPARVYTLPSKAYSVLETLKGPCLSPHQTDEIKLDLSPIKNSNALYFGTKRYMPFRIGRVPAPTPDEYFGTFAARAER